MGNTGILNIIQNRFKVHGTWFNLCGRIRILALTNKNATSKIKIKGVFVTNISRIQVKQYTQK